MSSSLAHLFDENSSASDSNAQFHEQTNVFHITIDIRTFYPTYIFFFPVFPKNFSSNHALFVNGGKIVQRETEKKNSK